MVAKLGRRFALASLLVNVGKGVADAWVRDGISKHEADALVERIIDGADAVEVSIGFVEQRLADALASNLELDIPPPFGLLHVIETLSLGPLHPTAISPKALAEVIFDTLPPGRTNAAATLAAHRASTGWAQKYGTLSSWFEAGEQVEQVLRRFRTRKQRLDAILTQLLPKRRYFWAEHCAWMAATLKESADVGDGDWIDLRSWRATWPAIVLSPPYRWPPASPPRPWKHSPIVDLPIRSASNRGATRRRRHACKYRASTDSVWPSTRGLPSVRSGAASPDSRTYQHESRVVIAERIGAMPVRNEPAGTGRQWSAPVALSRRVTCARDLTRG